MNGTAPRTSAYNGQQCVVGRARYEALDAEEKSLGMFPKMRETAEAIVRERP